MDNKIYFMLSISKNLYKIARKAISITLFSASVWGAYVLFKPSSPEIKTTQATNGYQIAHPFKIKNQSFFFPITDLNITCKLIEARIDNIRFNNDLSETNSFYKINASSSKPFLCSFATAVSINPQPQVKTATIRFDITYRSHFFIWSWKAESKSPLFTLYTKTNPPMWLNGNPLQ